MQDINQYYKYLTVDEDSPKEGSAPSESIWCDVGSVEMTGKRLCIDDFYCIPNEGVFVEVVPGLYAVTAECYSYGNDSRVARVRIQLKGAQPDTTEYVDSLDIDVGPVGIADGDRLERYSLEHSDAHSEWLEGAVLKMTHEKPAGFVTHEHANTVVCHLPGGFGDGTYRVNSIRQGEIGVGAEVVFLKPGQGYWEDDKQE